MSESKKIHISGMTCANCAKGIEKHLISKGIKDIVIDFPNSEARFVESEQNNTEKIIKEIESIGYKANVGEVQESNLVEKLFAISLIFTIPLFSHMFLNEGHILQNPLIQFFLALPVYLMGSYYFGRSAWNSLKTGVPNMDVLIMMGSTAAFFYSTIGSIIFNGTTEAHDYLFFETAATIITLVLLGNVLEHRSVKQTTSAIKELSAIQKLTAKREEKDGSIQNIPFKDILPNDILLVNSGDKIPTDGVIIYGNGYIDESMITGESEGISKGENTEVIGGTILLDGNIKIKAQKVGEKTVLSQIIKLVKQAQNDKPNIQKLGDKVSSIFVPVVLFISLLTFVISYYVFDINITDSIMRSVAVLVISCPCAMGLATPTAVMVGLGRAAKMGILIKGGNTLEEFAKVQHIVFDKTGTLTTGEFKLKEIQCEENQEKNIKNLLYSLEIHSSHPIAKSIRKSLENEATLLDISDIKETKGMGIQAKWNGDTYKLGSGSFINHSDDSYQLFLFKNDSILASIKCEDQQKENLSQTIQNLKKNGLTTTILSGDKLQKCIDLGQSIGVDKIYGEQLPHEKLEKIEQLNNNGLAAMVGDGINDAPALAKSHVGISLGGSTEVAIESAQIVVLNTSNLKQIEQAYKISQHTLLTIKQNLFWAFSYNIVAIPIAALGFLNPMWGALFMAFSDVIVIGNSLRLKRKKLL